MAKKCLTVLFTLCLAVACLGFAANTRAASESPVPESLGISLKDWKDDSKETKGAFLAGFIYAIELERHWQGSSPPPFKQSLVPVWSKGFADTSIPEIIARLDKYAADNPGDKDRSVVEVLWFLYAQPHIKEHLPRRTK